jgi:hypothetical protein
MDRAFRIALQAESASQNAAPAFLAVVVGKGSIAYTRDDGVAVIPMAYLGRSGFAGVPCFLYRKSIW